MNLTVSRAAIIVLVVVGAGLLVVGMILIVRAHRKNRAKQAEVALLDNYE